MIKDLNSSFPKRLELWMEGGILKYKVEEKKLDSPKNDFLRSNKEFFIKILKKTGSGKINVLPLAHNQKALWFLKTVNPENSSYNISLAAKIKNPINTDALETAFSLLTEKHQMLRTVFADLPGNESLACQIVLDKINPDFLQIDGLKLNDEEIRDLLYQKSREPFDFEQGPLFRVILVNASGFTIINFNFHHIICDAISLRNIFNEFIRIYSSIVQKENVKMIPKESDYSSFVFSQVEFLNSEKGTNQINYWMNQLAGKPHILNLNADTDRPALHRFKGNTILFRIEGERYKHLRTLARKNGATFNVLLLSIFDFFISRISLQSEFFVGLPASGRISKDLENIFGYFINLLPIGCSISDKKTFTEFLNENREHIYESLENQGIPFPIIVESFSPKRDLSRTPVFQVMFNYLNKKALGCMLHFLGDQETKKYSSWGSLLIKPFKIFDQEGQVDLTMEIIDDDKKLLCAFKYNSDLFNYETINNLKDEFLKITDLIINNPDVRPSWLSHAIAEKPEKPLLHINITGTFTVEPVKPYLEFWLDKFGVTPNISFPGYNQIFQQLINPGSEFNTNHDGYNIILIRFEDWIKENKSDNDFYRKVIELDHTFSEALQRNTAGKYILAFCPSSPQLIKNPGVHSIIKKAERKLSSSMKLKSNVIVICSDELIETYEVTDYYEELGEEVGHIPFTDEFFISLSTIIARKIHVSFSSPFKAIAVDCDNTLWKGVVGEDGPAFVTVGKPEQSLQKFLVDQLNSGILICLCSKNREEDVFEVFEKNSQMILKKEHIAFHRINWKPKSENLIQLAQEINIGLDSFVFIDDSPVECAEVRNNAPEVLTIQVPEGGFTISQLRNSWIFDRLRVTEEDRKRSEKYREEAVRSSFRSSVKSYRDFIMGLDLKIEIVPFRDETIPRISQLTYRTNQFNFTAFRKSESEINNISADKNFECFQVSLTDRFGEYGLIGVIIADKSKDYTVDTFLLSCRVLGKGVEHALISFLGRRAGINKSGILSIRFRKTDKNIPARDFLMSNFADLSDGNDDIQTFNIPVERATSFSFDPESNIAEPETANNEIIKANPENFLNHSKNDFYYMVVDKYISLEKLITELNSIVRKQPEPLPVSSKSSGQTEKNISLVWQQVLRSGNFSDTDNFFDIGGHSVLIPQIVIKLFKQFNIEINIVDIFQFPTIRELAAYIDGTSESEIKPGVTRQNTDALKSSGNDIAVIGMAGRFSGVSDINGFWDAISSGKETITFYTREELQLKGVDMSLLENKDYVLANGIIESSDKFDSSFFGVAPREADFMDPQHRVFLETCYEALENSGYTSEKYSGDIGVFGGCGMNNYLVKNLFQHPESLRTTGEFQTIINNNSDYLTTRVSYKMNLTGPSIDIQTACSTSLVAIHIACKNLISRDCDIALAGGVSIHIPHAEGYMYEAGGILSSDGHCRPFDSEANGTLFGEGSGVVVLKRLDDARRDCDTISAIIKGSAINNDGSVKVGYMAPSVNGQATVVSKAIAVAGVSPDSISYIETHGTGTKLGDPIEFNALKIVFSKYLKDSNYCALGSVKANIGHLDAAAGVAGVIKVIMMLKNKKLPPLVNFKIPNIELPLKDTPFYFNTSLTDWPASDGPRHAGISSFGVGGTNVHCILEEAPEVVNISSLKKFHLLPVTAKTQGALKNLEQSITQHILNSGQDIADISFTLQNGRSHFKYRSLLVYKTKPDDNTPLNVIDAGNSGIQELVNPQVVFMFTGQGSQYAGMTKDLYNEFPSFRNIVDKANIYLKKDFNLDILKYILYTSDDSLQDEINQTSVAQPLLFTVQYALTVLLEEFGVRPDVVIGHSIGEYSAAVTSGIFEFEDALKLVAWRGKLMQEQKPGAMLSVQLPYEKVLPFITSKVNLSLKNAPDINVLSGNIRDIEEVNERLTADYPEVHIARLKTSHAFHSYMMEPVLEPFNVILETIKFGESKIPFISNKTGTWAGSTELSVPGYWTNQIRSTVNFVDGVQELIKRGNYFFVEVGPGSTLATLLSQYDTFGSKVNIVSTVRHPKKKSDDVSVFLKSVSHAWVKGINTDWSNYYKDEKRFRVPLPSYPFTRKRHWIDPVTPFNYFSETGTRHGGNSTASEESDFRRADVTEIAIELHDRAHMDNEYIPPVSDTEKEVVKIWEDLLGINGIGLEDDFFHLGGHSLLASRLINRISEKFHIRLPLESLFCSPTIKGLIRKIESEAPSETDDPGIITLDPEGMLPVSLDQKRLWVINQLDRNNPAYNIPFTYRLKGKLDTAIFIKSLNNLFQRQSILRSSIRSLDGKPYCIINKYENLPVQFLDFSGYTPEKVEMEIQKFFTLQSREPFDIENGPLFRIFLAKINDNENVFHLTVQHMVFDGWSWGIFAGELRQIYNDLLGNKGINLKALKYQYYDLADWQQKYVDGNDHSELIEYWKEQLKGHPSEINFPYDHRRKSTWSGLGSKEPLRLSVDISERLRSLGQSENATVFMTMLAAFGLLLNKYSGDNDICVGAPVANRDNSDIEGIIGLLVNTIVLRMRFNDKQSFRDLLRLTRETAMNALTHKNLPFEKLVDTLQPDRKVNVNPITQIMFAYQNTPRPPLLLKGIVPERIMIKDTVSPFDLTFYAWEENGIIEGELEYNSDILERDTIIRLRENFIHLLNLIVGKPEEPVAGLSLLSEEETRKIESFSGTCTGYPKDKTIVQLFEEQALLFPDKQAVIYKKDSFTYRELNEKANQLAVTLRQKGVTSNMPVGILAEKSAELIVGILAILKAGGGYLPIDPDYPQQRIDFILEDSECKVLLMQERFMKLPFRGLTKISLESADSYNTDIPFVNGTGSSSDLAYIMYTSGTTGKPKGSMILQYGVVRLIRDTNYIKLIPSDRILLTGAIVFDATTFEIWGALLNGCSLYIVDKETILDAEALGEELAINGITLLWLTSSLFTHLAEKSTDIFSGLKYLFTGGDIISAPHINKVRKNNPDLNVFNAYGPTENTTFSTTFLINEDFESNIPIGKPVSNSTVYIFDKSLNYQPIGVIGELFVGGDGVAKGYLKREDLNNKCFIQNPHRKGERLYRTGDNGRWLPDGNIEFHGRIDSQLKIRGFRVELEEIESVISEIDGVVETIVKPFQLEDGDKRLAAFLNVHDSFKINAKELAILLKGKLPLYMIPSNYTFMQGFPKTINGKTDRAALIVEISNTPSTDRKDPGKLTVTEKIILEIWNESLRNEGITVDDNFFEVGGNSLLAISVFSKIESAFKIKLSLRIFFDSPRIRDLAETIDIHTQKTNVHEPVKRLVREESRIVKGKI